MVKVSATLKNRHFLTVMQFFTLWEGCLRPKICINKVCSRGSKNRKPYQKFKIMLESCQETSKLSVDSFMVSLDRMVPQKWYFLKKIFKKVAKTCSTPPAKSTARHKLRELRKIGFFVLRCHFLTFSHKWKNQLFANIVPQMKFFMKLFFHKKKL